jgi:hypothetical protein
MLGERRMRNCLARAAPPARAMPVSSIPRQSLTAEVCANFGLEIGRLAMRAEETGKVLQSQESLLRRAQKAEMQPEAMEIGGPALAHRGQVVHGDEGLPADPLLVVTYELDRLFPAEDIDRGVFLQLADQFEILLKDSMRR